jgi:hypothetical protein
VGRWPASTSSIAKLPVATLAWLLSQWQLPEHLKVPAGYHVEQLRRFKDELAERMAVAAHPTT